MAIFSDFHLTHVLIFAEPAGCEECNATNSKFSISSPICEAGQRTHLGEPAIESLGLFSPMSLVESPKTTPHLIHSWLLNSSSSRTEEKGKGHTTEPWIVSSLCWSRFWHRGGSRPRRVLLWFTAKWEAGRAGWFMAKEELHADREVGKVVIEYLLLGQVNIHGKKWNWLLSHKNQFQMTHTWHLEQ